MRSGLRQLTCPFCFTSFGCREVRFRCIDPRCPRQDPDTVYAEATGRPPQMGHVFPAPNLGGPFASFRIPLSARCDACKKESKKRLCPQCHFELSHDAGLIEDKIIAVVGGKDTGKSHYIATLVNRLEHEVGANFGFGLRMLGDSTRTRFENDFRGPLFRRKTVLQTTQPGDVDSQVKMPMIFRLTLHAGGRRHALNLSFFDTAGEDMKSLDRMSVEARYITAASGIIFLLDPLQIEAVRQQLPGANLPRPDPLSEPTYIIDRLRELFESQSRVTATQKVEVPVAFTLAKSDALFPIVEAGSLLRRPGEHFGVFNQAESRSLHTEIWNYLETWTGAGFNSRVEQGFARSCYFGVSSLGRQPDGDGRVETVSSLRVEDPFLWILHQLGLIKGSR